MKLMPFALTILLAICSLGCGMTNENAGSGENLFITTLPADVIYNATRDVKLGIESDFLLKAVKIANDGKEAIEVKSMTFTIFANEREIFSLIYRGEELNSFFGKYVEKFEKMTYDFQEGIFLGTTGFVDLKKSSKSAVIEPGQEAAIINIPFRFYSDNPATKCNIHIEFQQGDKTFSRDLGLQVAEYVLKNKYIFPAKGIWMAINTYNANYGHRVNSSQEFAFDLMIQKPNLMMYPPSGKNEDYDCWGKAVIASADGVVIDCVDGVPNNPSYLGSRLPKEELERVREKFGAVAMAGGNYVILEHPGSEYTFYAHLINGSVKVKKGDMVKQGQVLGLCGNSGNSDAPHLHFNIMNGPSVLGSRGLPMKFTNLKDFTSGKIEQITDPNLVVLAE